MYCNINNTLPSSVILVMLYYLKIYFNSNEFARLKLQMLYDRSQITK